MVWQSAVSRCPREIWSLILRFAVYSPRPIIPVNSRAVEGYEWYNNQILDNHYICAVRRADAMISTTTLAEVCRAWREEVYIVFLRWITIGRRGLLTPTLQILRDPSGYQKKGDRVQRLELIFEMGPRDDIAGNIVEKIARLRADSETISFILRECPRLEELEYDTESFMVTSTNLGSLLGATCGRTLRHLRIISGFQASSQEMSTLLDQCPRLETLAFLDSGNDFLDDPPTSPLLPPMSLQSLSWFATPTSIVFLERLALLDMPALRHVSIKLAFSETDDPGIVSVHEALSPRITTFIEAHGSKLFSLEINTPNEAGDDDWLTFQLLELCPNLEDCFLDLNRALQCPLKQPHASLRRIICHSLFLRPYSEAPIGSDDLSDFVDHLRFMFETICGTDFPNLQTIKCLDLLPPAERFGADESTNGCPEDYRALVREAIILCNARGIRLENVMGELAGADFLAPWAQEPQNEEHA